MRNRTVGRARKNTLRLVTPLLSHAAADSHYTPPAVAETLVGAAKDLRPTLVADLAAGSGHLLLEAERVWPTADFAATDIDRRAIARLTRMRSSWNIGRCDLRNRRSRSHSRVLRGIRRSISLLLLNPPFSCRGGTRFRVDTSDGTLHASTAMSFLLLATQYMSDAGVIVAVLPQGCVSNAKDAQAWEYLKAKYTVSSLGIRPKGTFPGTAATTALVRLSPNVHRATAPPALAVATTPLPRISVKIVRGCCPAHRMTRERQDVVLVHYTDLRSGSVETNGRRGFGDYRCVDGPAIVLPRVGRITVEKVALLGNSQRVMLSDCVIALKPTSLNNARLLRDRLTENFSQLSTQYVGTGAPFITLHRLRTALEVLGVQVD